MKIWYVVEIGGIKSPSVPLLEVFLEYEGPIKAPISKNQKIANLIVSDKGVIIKSLPLYASEKVSKVNFFKSLITSLNYLIWGDV